MTRLHVQLLAALVVAVAPTLEAHAQRATALTAAFTRPLAPQVRFTASTAADVADESSQNSKVLKGALIGAGIGAVIGVLAVAGKSTPSGPDHLADSDSKVILIPGAAVLGALLGVIIASRL
jgi:hypothetical protein